MATKLSISHAHLSIINAILSENLTDEYHVWIFGSYAKNLADRSSDLDLAIEGASELQPRELILLKEKFDDAPLPFKVDIIDLLSVSPSFRKMVAPSFIPFPLRKRAFA